MLVTILSIAIAMSIPLLGLTWPICHLIFKGHEYGGRDEHRASPQSPWYFFRKRVLKGSIILGCIWIPLTLFLSLFTQVRAFENGQPIPAPMYFALAQASVVFAIIFTLAGLAAAFALLLVNRIRNYWALTTLIMFTSVLVLLGGWLALEVLLPDQFTQLVHRVERPNTSLAVSVPLVPLYHAAITVVILTITLISVRRADRRWFPGYE